MSNLNLSLVIGLKDQLIGPLQRAVADAERSLGTLGKVLGQIDTSGSSAATSVTNLAAKTQALGAAQGAGKLANDMGQVASSADIAQQKMGRLSAVMGKMPGLVEKASAAFLGLAAAKKIMDVPISAFGNLEEANTALKVTMMKKGGAVSGNYGAIQKIAVELGNKLPGTTKDFIGSANELLSLGVSEKAVVNGGLVSAAHLGVVLKMPPQQAAESVAKMREAYGLKDDELPGMADEMQRNRFAFGIKPGDMLQSAKYMAPSLNTLGISGKQSMSEMLTLQGMANLKGMDGSQFGTNMDMLLQRLAKGPLMLAESKRGMKAEARHLMDKSGINFEFYDKQGKLKTEDGSPVKGMLRELEKLQTVKEKLGDKAAMEVAGGLFGQEAARPAQILAGYGVKGYEEAREKVGNQATLEERTTETLTTLNAKIEATTGSFENLNAAMGKQLGESSKPKLDKINSALGTATDFMTDHPAAGTATVLTGAAAVGVAAMKFGGAMLAKLFGGAPAVVASPGAGGSLAGLPVLDGQKPLPGASAGGKLASGLRGLGIVGSALALGSELFTTSDEDIATLNAADARKDKVANGSTRTDLQRAAQETTTDGGGSGVRGAGFIDPRLLTLTQNASTAATEKATADLASASASLLAQTQLLKEIAQRPIHITIDGRQIAAEVDSQNQRSARRQ